MKKLLLFIALAIAGFNSFGSHMMGGQITAKNIGGLTYEVTATFYRDMTGIAMPQVMAFCYTDVTTNTTLATNNVPQLSFSFFGNGTEEYVYIDVITFPNAGNYKIAISECCRNPLSLNFPNPSGYTFYLEDELWADPSNSSPVFLNPPVPVAQLNVPFTYNPMPFDADGDNLTWVLDVPMDGYVPGPGTPVAGYVLPFSDPLSPFTLNPLTGEISFLPNTAGSFQVSILINEFRNGVQIGKIRRDMQILVLSSPNQPPVNSISSGTTTPYTGTSYTISPGSTFNVSLASYDPDGSALSIIGAGEALLLQSNPATFSSTNSAGMATATIDWTPNISHERTQPYIVALRIVEPYQMNTFNTDISFSLHVGNATGIKDNSTDVVRGIYPNPSDGNFTVEMNSEKGQSVSLSISNVAGQQLKSFTHELNAGINLLNVRNLNLPEGTYILSIVKEGSVLQTRTFEIRN